MAECKDKILPLDGSDREVLNILRRFIENPFNEKEYVKGQLRFAAEGFHMWRSVFSMDQIHGCRVNAEQFDVDRVARYLRDYGPKVKQHLATLCGLSMGDHKAIKFLGTGDDAIPEGSKPVFMCCFPLVQMPLPAMRCVANPSDMVVYDCRRFGQSKIPKAFYGPILYFTREKVEENG